ncbi:relaxase domain-containing protein [Streptomyces sp. NBC_00892]|uniref:relaxase domain-containing protein n=1 Tax=Streptomyces sp. NBC_00892 TaxID=2975861 RepID=UPI00224D23C2|nr:relaxase domain-containing protein [Streptomyces sp. NBC_00892]MCX4902381.1 relaxase domain-containing protein [Streptomyces sp. NBC_00892]
MLSVAKIQRRNAWRYYIRGVAFGDGHRPADQSLKDAQELAGLPPGRWLGRGLRALGLTEGGQVSERQLELLFGQGRHPDADRIERGLLDDGSARVPRILDMYSGEPVCRRPHSAVVNGRFALVVAFRRGTGKVK